MTTTTVPTGPTLAVRDSITMVRRNLRRMVRYPSMTLLLIGQPIIFMLLFVYVFGGTLGAGLSGPGGDNRADYLAFQVPGVLAMTVASVALGTAINVAMDMTTGVVARFRTMDIARVSVLSGHVVGAVLQTVIALVVVGATAVLLGYRPDTSVVDVAVLVALLLAFTFALTWLTVALGLVSDSVETASNTPMPLVLLPFLSSGFVPTDQMPTGLRWFCEHQPFTPVIDSARHLLDGTPAGGDLWLAFAWSAVIAMVGYLWSRRLYNRERTAAGPA